MLFSFGQPQTPAILEHEHSLDGGASYPSHARFLLKHFDQALNSGDTQQCLYILEQLGNHSNNPQLHKSILFRKVYLFRIAGFVTEAMKLFDMCHLYLDMNNNERDWLLWQQYLMRFYVNFDLKTLTHSFIRHLNTQLAPWQAFQIYLITKASPPRVDEAKLLEQIQPFLEIARPDTMHLIVAFLTIKDFINSSAQHNEEDALEEHLLHIQKNIIPYLPLYERVLTKIILARHTSTNLDLESRYNLLQRYVDISQNISKDRSLDVLGMIYDILPKHRAALDISRHKTSKNTPRNLFRSKRQNISFTDDHLKTLLQADVPSLHLEKMTSISPKFFTDQELIYEMVDSDSKNLCLLKIRRSSQIKYSAQEELYMKIPGVYTQSHLHFAKPLTWNDSYIVLDLGATKNIENPNHLGERFLHYDVLVNLWTPLLQHGYLHAKTPSTNYILGDEKQIIFIEYQQAQFLKEQERQDLNNLVNNVVEDTTSQKDQQTLTHLFHLTQHHPEMKNISKFIAYQITQIPIHSQQKLYHHLKKLLSTRPPLAI